MPSAVTRLNLVSFSFGVLKLSSLMGLFSALPLWRDLAAADLGPAAGAPAGAAPQAIYRLYHAYMTRYHPYVSRDCAGHHPVIHSQGNPRRAYSSRQRLVVGIVRAQDWPVGVARIWQGSSSVSMAPTAAALGRMLTRTCCSVLRHAKAQTRRSCALHAHFSQGTPWRCSRPASGATAPSSGSLRGRRGRPHPRCRRRGL